MSYLKKMNRAINTVRAGLFNTCLPLYWCNTKSNQGNWGDEVNVYLCEKLSGKKVLHTSGLYHPGKLKSYSAIGSILDNIHVRNLTVWGSGFKFENSRMKIPPDEIRAVRGKLTRQKILDLGLSCPEIYGDPALLMPGFYSPRKSARYQLGIIPHLVDREAEALHHFRDDENVLIVDVSSGITEFIDMVLSCQYIASSSLHGLIVADAYGIPSAWIHLSDNILGGTFKFLDYFSAVGREETLPLEVTGTTGRDQILNSMWDQKPDIDLDRLHASCPFQKV